MYISGVDGSAYRYATSCLTPVPSGENQDGPLNRSGLRSERAFYVMQLREMFQLTGCISSVYTHPREDSPPNYTATAKKRHLS